MDLEDLPLVGGADRGHAAEVMIDAGGVGHKLEISRRGVGSPGVRRLNRFRSDTHAISNSPVPA